MRKQALADCGEMYFTIHTMSIRTSDILCCNSERAAGCIKKSHVQVDKDSGEMDYRVVLNFHHWCGIKQDYGSWKASFDALLLELGIVNYVITRVDFAVDFVNDNFDGLYKIHRLIVLLLGLEMNLNNRYESNDPLTLERLTVKAQSEYWEVENYNKLIQSKGTDPAKNRIEFRAKSLQKKVATDVPTLAKLWVDTMKKCIRQYERLQELLNTYLLKRWECEKGREVRSIGEFIRKYQDNIFTRKQLKRFLNMAGCAKPESKANYYSNMNQLSILSKIGIRSHLYRICATFDRFVLSGAPK